MTSRVAKQTTLCTRVFPLLIILYVIFLAACEHAVIWQNNFNHPTDISKYIKVPNSKLWERQEGFVCNMDSDWEETSDSVLQC